MPHYPEELRDTVDLLNRVAQKHGYSYAGMMINTEERMVISIGNVTELTDSVKLAELFQTYATVLEHAEAAGIVQREKSLPPM